MCLHEKDAVLLFNRIHTHLARLEADRANADDVVLLDDRGLLTESRGANVFLVRGGALGRPTPRAAASWKGSPASPSSRSRPSSLSPPRSATSPRTISTPPTKPFFVAPPAASSLLSRLTGGRS